MMYQERERSTSLVSLRFPLRTILNGIGKFALGFSPLVIQVELLLSFSLARGGRRLLQPGQNL